MPFNVYRIILAQHPERGHMIDLSGETVSRFGCGAAAEGFWGTAVCEEPWGHEGPHIAYTVGHRVSWSGAIYTALPRAEQ